MTIKTLITAVTYAAGILMMSPPVSGETNQNNGNPLQSFVKKQIELGSRADRWIEGYSKALSGLTMPYHSSSPGINEALICRATDGTMSVSWETAPPPPDLADTIATFVWLCGLGVNMGEAGFTLEINGTYELKFRSFNRESWETGDGSGVSIKFLSMTADVHKDLFGYMFLHLPRKYFPSDQPLRLKVTGDNAGSQAWFMVFRHETAVNDLRGTARHGFWYELEWEDESERIRISFPSAWSGRRMSVSFNNEIRYSGILQSEGDRCRIIIDLRRAFPEKSNFPAAFSLDGVETDQIQFSDLIQPISEFSGNRLFILRHPRRSGNNKFLEASGHPFNQYELFRKITDSHFRNGTLNLITSSHQDIAWMDDPFTCVEERDSIVITPALKMLEERPDYHYSIEDALMLREYIKRHPGSIRAIHKYALENRLEFGATYTQPYEGLLSGEALIRQIYFGRKWLKKILPGYDPRVAWNLDVPGRTLQMPQILKKSGVDYLMHSRHDRGFFHWKSPDGSSVGTYSPGHYHVATDFLRSDPFESFITTPQTITSWEPFYELFSLPPAIPLLFTSDMSSPKDFTNLFNLWNSFSVSGPADDTSERSLPRLKYNIAQNLLDTIFSRGAYLPTIQGERPNVWLYIHGPTHHHAISAAREGAILLTAAEKFSAVHALLKNDSSEYPQDDLNRAWESHIYPDHGWGGKDGAITDSLFRRKYEFARDEGRRLLENALDGISGSIKTDAHLGIPLVIYNELSWKRTDPVKKKLEFGEGEALDLRIIDENKNEIKSELHDVTLHKDGSIKSGDVLFIGEDIPSVGYRVYYAQPIKKPFGKSHYKPPAENKSENQFYRIEFKPGGISDIYDKELGVKLFSTEKFLAGELFTMKSVGNGAGEFSEIQQPTMEGFDKLGNYASEWRIIHDGEVSTRAMIEQKLEHCLYRQTVTMYKKIKRIDFDAEILGWDGTPYREFRLAFPLNISGGNVTYEAPFGTVTVGKDEIPGAAGERYVQEASDVRPREIQNWISASGDRFGLTLSTSTAVCDFSDPTDNPVDYPVFQPLLLASRKSCHGEGNWYLQEGDHRYRFSVFSHSPGWKNGARLAVQANAPLRVSVKKSAASAPVLPTDFSFFSLSSDNVIISTIKKCEDDRTCIIRCYEQEGKTGNCVLSIFKDPSGIEKVNLIEEGGELLTRTGSNLNIQVGPYGIETYKIRIKN